MRTYQITRFLFCCCTLLLLQQQDLFAQTQRIRALNAAYFELGGNSDVYSFNLDRILYQDRELKLGLRVGVGTNLFFLEQEPELYPVVPVEAFSMFGRDKKHFEFGLGYTHRFTDSPSLIQQMYFSRIGFRYQVPRGGLLVRVGATPFITTENITKRPGVGVIPRFGLSIGQSF